MTAAVVAAREEHPALDVPADVFRPYVCARLDGSADETARGAALAQLQVGDLYVACGCALGRAEAVRAFEARAMGAIDAAVASLSADGDFAAEIKQRVREQLLVARDGAPPRIVEYRGRGPLSRWVRIIAVRAGLQLMRGEKRLRQRTASLPDGLAEAFDHELGYLRARYKRELEGAMEHALESLTPRERTVLKLHVLEGVSLSRIGALHGVDKSTVSRWLAHARARVAAEVRRHLSATLELPDGELESLLGLFESNLDLSISRLFPREAS